MDQPDFDQPDMDRDGQPQDDAADAPTPVVPARAPIAPSSTGLVVGDGSEPVEAPAVDDVAPEEETG